MQGTDMGAMKQMYQTINEAGLSPHVIEYAVVVDGRIQDTYEDEAAARRDARMVVENAVIARGKCYVSVEVVPFMQFEPEVFAGESSGIQ